MFQLKVPDMNCRHCAGTITDAVSKLRGVRKVDADPATKIVSIEVEGEVDRAAVTQAVIDAGFHPEQSTG